MNVEKWNKNKGEITLENIQKIYPKDKYRVSRNRYADEHKSFTVTTKEGLLIVLEGEVMIEFKSESATVKAGEMVQFPSGDYLFSILGEQPAEVVNVWDLEEFFKSIKVD